MVSAVPPSNLIVVFFDSSNEYCSSDDECEANCKGTSRAAARRMTTYLVSLGLIPIGLDPSFSFRSFSSLLIKHSPEPGHSSLTLFTDKKFRPRN